MSDHRLPSSSAVQATTLFSNRRLTPEEFQAYVDAPVSEAEREEALPVLVLLNLCLAMMSAYHYAAQRAYARWTAHRR